MQQHGMVLLVTLLFVFVLTGLLLTSMENNVLENKLALNSQQNAIAFQAAEAGLVAGEAAIRGKHMELPVTRVRVSYREKLLSVNKCFKKRYQIVATARYHSVSVRLLALYDWLSKTNRVACKNQVGGRRFYWDDINWHSKILIPQH